MFITFIIADVIVIIVLLGLVLSFFKADSEDKPSVKFSFLNETYKTFASDIKEQMESNETEGKKKKEKKKKELNANAKRVYILNFKGGVFAEEVEKLREEITAVMLVARSGLDEVIIKIDSPGGMVSAYGLVATELHRIRNRAIKVTAVVDRVAASGGYMVACVADRIVAAPFAYIGSVGVVSEFPNFNSLLNKVGVDWKTYTAGESKRDVGQYGKITPDAEKRHNKKLKEIHLLFKKHIHQYRKNVDLSKIATGECWTGQEALDLKLVDELGVSDDIIMEQIKWANVYKVHTPDNRDVIDKVLGSVTGAVMVQVKAWIFNINTEKLMQ